MAGENETVSAPIAKRAPVERVHHGDTFVDDYEWLRDKEDPVLTKASVVSLVQKITGGN